MRDENGGNEFASPVQIFDTPLPSRTYIVNPACPGRVSEDG